MIAALVGNPNCGKTTLFNRLTGKELHVGNFPGVTVSASVGSSVTDGKVEFADLPGIYSLSEVSEDERCAVDFIKCVKPDIIVNVLDSTCLSRGLALTAELFRFGIPIVAVLTMTDELRRRGGSVDTDELSRRLSVPVVRAWNGTGEISSELSDILCSERALPTPHEAIGCGASKPEERYRYADRVLSGIYRCAQSSGPSGGKLDRLLAGRWARWMFALILSGAFFIIFGVVSPAADSVSERAIAGAYGMLERLLGAPYISPIVRSLVCDGLVSGVGSVLSYLPVILSFFFVMSMIEDSGYAARCAYVFDAPLRRIGLSGRCMVPLICGGGCSVPAVMSTRTLTGGRERAICIFLIPYVSCSAKIPIYTTLCRAHLSVGAAVLPLIYIFALSAGLALSTLISGTGRGGEELFILEMPPYRVPSPYSSMRLMYRRTCEFLRRAFGIIFVSSAAVSIFANLTPQLTVPTVPEESILWQIGNMLVPLFSPLGFGSAAICAALLSGITAKEAIVSTLAVTLSRDHISLQSALSAAISPAAAVSLAVFIATGVPCIAAVGAVRQETGSVRRTVLYVAAWFAISYVLSLIAYSAASAVLCC